MPKTNDAIVLTRELDAARRTLEGQQSTLKATLAVIDLVKSPEGTIPVALANRRNRQHQAVVNTEAYIQRVENALKAAK